MKILFLSDIHGQCENLEKIESLIQKKNFDLIVILGDLCSYGLKNIDDKIFQFLNSHMDHIICMRGNCDTDGVVREIGFSMEEGLKKLMIDGINIYLNHGHYYSYEKRRYFLDKEGVLIYGHYHVPYIKSEGKMTYICVGSISCPRNNSSCSYLIYQDKLFVLYDIEGNILDSVEIARK